MAKERLDVVLVKRGLYESREKAKRALMEGRVYVNKCLEDKPGMKIDDESIIDIKEDKNPYVSRGGLKLKKGLDYFNIHLNNKYVIDIGASTGGFTDCMLKHGAKKVIAVDVGYGQLAWSLRSDERVVCIERKNARYLECGDVPYLSDICTIDVSFISLKKILPRAVELLKSEGEIICLIKPQFEAGREKVGKRGVVRKAETHIEVVADICIFALTVGLMIKGITFSPIKGPEGNIEYISYMSKKEGMKNGLLLKAAAVRAVQEAHKTL